MRKRPQPPTVRPVCHAHVALPVPVAVSVTMAPRAALPFLHRERLSPWALGVLRATSIGIVVLGSEMLHAAADMRAAAARHARAAALRNPNATGLVTTMPHQSVADAFDGVGRMTIVLGALSTLNYVLYTGVPNLVSVVDGGAAIAATATFVWHTVRLWADGMASAPLFLAVVAANAALWAARTRPNQHVAVHAVGVSALAWWMVEARRVAHLTFKHE